MKTYSPQDYIDKFGTNELVPIMEGDNMSDFLATIDTITATDTGKIFIVMKKEIK